MRKIKKSDLIFLPLGGCNEIGMNVNLYHYQGKWIMIDLGAGFAGDYHPGINMLAPDLSFVESIRDDLLAIVLTHAHEDHLGSVGYLWEDLQVPIYATPFTAGLAKHKLKQSGVDEKVVHIIQPGAQLSLGPFEMSLCQLTHSVPEMQAIILHTEHGDIVHTGDWKFDPTPLVNPTSDFKKLKAIGEKGALALVCDSTNILREKFAGSEAELEPHLREVMDNREGLVVVTTFASNVARLETIAKVAEQVGRKVVLAGWSLHRINTIARECGYLQDTSPFLADTEMKRHRRDKLVVIATGCQAEPNAAMHKISYDKHPTVKLRKGDHAIFSSKIIPGNEKRIFSLFNQLVKKGVEIYTEKDHFVHVSGHPSREEMKQMYDLTKPQIAVPVHGEPVHIHEHATFAKKLPYVKTALQVENGEMVKLAPGKPSSVQHVDYGYLAVDGDLLQPEDGIVMQMRRRMQNDGCVNVSVVFDKQAKLAAHPKISTPGLFDESVDDEFIQFLQDETAQLVKSLGTDSNFSIEKQLRNMLKKLVRNESGKYPLIFAHIIRL